MLHPHKQHVILKVSADNKTFYLSKRDALRAGTAHNIWLKQAPNVDLNNINLDNNFDEDNPDTIILIRHLAWHNKYAKRKAPKKKMSEELMSIARGILKDGEVFACRKMKKEIDFY